MTRAIILAAALLTVTGCGGGRLVPAEGKVTLDGAPVAGASLTFYSASPADSFAHGASDGDGHFGMSTGNDKGVAPGRYKVTVTKIEASVAADGKDKSGRLGGIRAPKVQKEFTRQSTVNVLPRIYSNATSTPLSVDVPPGGSKNLEVPLQGARDK